MSLDLERSLTDIGLERNEARVYTALLRLKSASAGEIAKHTGMHRRSVYDTVDGLLRKGFATYIRKNDIRYYQTAGIEKLREEVKRKENALESIHTQLASLENRRVEHGVAVYEGIGGVKSAIHSIFDQASESSELTGFGEKSGLSSLASEFVDKMTQIRKRKKIRMRRLVNRSPDIVKKLSKSHWGQYLHDQKLMPEGFQSPLGIWTCGEKTVILYLKDNPLAIVVESPEISKGFKEQFEFFWTKGGTVVTSSAKGKEDGFGKRTSRSNDANVRRRTRQKG